MNEAGGTRKGYLHSSFVLDTMIYQQRLFLTAAGSDCSVFRVVKAKWGGWFEEAFS